MKKNASEEILGLALELFIQTSSPQLRGNETHRYIDRYIDTPDTTKLLQILNYLKICHTNNIFPYHNSSTKLDEFLFAFYKEIYPHGTNITEDAVKRITDEVIKLFNSKIKEYEDQCYDAKDKAALGILICFASLIMFGGLPNIIIWILALNQVITNPFFHSSTFTITAYVYIALVAIGVLISLLSIFRFPHQESFFKREIEPSLSRIIENIEVTH